MRGRSGAATPFLAVLLRVITLDEALRDRLKRPFCRRQRTRLDVLLLLEQLFNEHCPTGKQLMKTNSARQLPMEV